MLTRWEVEGGLRSLDPLRFQKRRVRRERLKKRHRVHSGVGVLLGVGLFAAICGLWLRPSGPGVATLQDTEWADGYVGSYRRQEHEPLFPLLKRSPWESHAARAHAARDPITGARRYPKLLARE